MAFYQKYRPQTLEDVVGQEFVKETLETALLKNQVAHAYLFFGSRGTGKTSTARILAKSLNCLTPTNTGGPCNTCAHCTAADTGSFVDMIEIDGASNRKIEHARALIEKINFAPTLGTRKVYIIDEVHMLTKEAFNALLKTIEEPPAHAVFLLATTELNKVPETIRSRCQTFTFHRFTPEQIAGRLEYIAEKEGIVIEDREALLYIAKKASGGLRDAIGLFQQASSSGTLSLTHLQQELGVISDSVVEEFLEMVFAPDAGKAISFISDIASQGLSLDSFLEQILGSLREKMIVSATQSTAQTAELSVILDAIDVFEIARRGMKDSPIPTLPLEIAIVKTTRTHHEEGKSGWKIFGKKSSEKAVPAEKKREIPPAPVQKKSEPIIEKKENLASEKPEKKSVPEASYAATDLTQENLSARWPSLVQSLPDVVLKGALMQAQVGLDAEKNIAIAFAADSWKKQAEDTKRRSLLQSAAQEVFGPRTNVVFTSQSVILEPVGTPTSPAATNQNPVTDPSVVSEILGLPTSA